MKIFYKIKTFIYIKIYTNLMNFLKKKNKENNKMDLFKKKEEKKEEENVEDSKEEYKNVSESEVTENKRMTKEEAETRFKILVRHLNDVELQIKSGKPTDVDETKQNKIPTLNRMISYAEEIKLSLSEFMDAFRVGGYSEEDIMKLRSDALEGKKNYVYFTID